MHPYVAESSVTREVDGALDSRACLLRGRESLRHAFWKNQASIKNEYLGGNQGNFDFCAHLCHFCPGDLSLA